VHDLVLQACTELERSRQTLSSSNQALQQQVVQLQQQLEQRDAAQAASGKDQQQLLAALKHEKQELSADLAAVRQAETSHRLSTAEASSKIERLRGELLRCVGELQAQLAASATAGQRQQQAQAQLRALEATAAAAQAEAAEMRQQLVELASVTMAELREQVAGEAVAITGLPDDMGPTLPGPVANYIKVG
jgi:chromosome segregation ATPase